jgi:hypothetical protein
MTSFVATPPKSPHAPRETALQCGVLVPVEGKYALSLQFPLNPSSSP